MNDDNEVMTFRKKMIHYYIFIMNDDNNVMTMYVLIWSLVYCLKIIVFIEVKSQKIFFYFIKKIQQKIKKKKKLRKKREYFRNIIYFANDTDNNDKKIYIFSCTHETFRTSILYYININCKTNRSYLYFLLSHIYVRTK